MDIGKAIEAMHEGELVRRAGWNGKGMYLYLVNGVRDYDQNKDFDPFVVMKHAGGGIIPWLCSQSDLLANDWEVIKNY